MSRFTVIVKRELDCLLSFLPRGPCTALGPNFVVLLMAVGGGGPEATIVFAGTDELILVLTWNQRKQTLMATFQHGHAILIRFDLQA